MASLEPPNIVVRRLPLYLRALNLLSAEGHRITSSKELAERLGISSAQIRKDLSHFGEFGKQGTGYEIANLSEQLRRILKLDREWPVVLIGAGDLGRALVLHSTLQGRGFRITAVFDNSPAKIGQQWGEVAVQDMRNVAGILRQDGIQIGIVAVPQDQAQSVVNTLIEAGITAILSYAPIAISVPSGIRIEYMDPILHLQRMTYYL